MIIHYLVYAQVQQNRVLAFQLRDAYVARFGPLQAPQPPPAAPADDVDPAPGEGTQVIIT